RINPVTGRALQLLYPTGAAVTSLVATPTALWWLADYTHVSGLTNAGGLPNPVTAPAQGYQPPGSGGLAYDSGSIWVLWPVERVVRIDAATGAVVRRYTFRTYDPARLGGLDYLTAAGGWLWFLDNGYPFSGVLRVSEATGRPDGGVPIPAGS